MYIAAVCPMGPHQGPKVKPGFAACAYVKGDHRSFKWGRTYATREAAKRNARKLASKLNSAR